MTGNWAQTETVRGKGSAANCMLCGRKPHILEKGYCDGSHSFYICCPHCWNKHFKDKRETGVDITVVAENIYDAIKDWNKVNGAFYGGYRQALDDVEHLLSAQFSKHVEEYFLFGEVGKKQNYDFQRDYNGQFKKGGSENDRT